MQGLRSGSTGVVAVVEPDAVHIAWLGDSQVMLLKDGLPVPVMEPHKPERPVSMISPLAMICFCIRGMQVTAKKQTCFIFVKLDLNTTQKCSWLR